MESVKSIFPEFIQPACLKTFREWGALQRSVMHRLITGAVVIGTPGASKSFEFSEADGRYSKRSIYIAGSVTAYTAFMMIRDVCAAADKNNKHHPPVVFDDVHDLLQDPHKIDLLRQICSVREVEHGRPISYMSKAVGKRNKFICKSPVLILGNDLPKNISESQYAVFSRMETYYFAPDAEEIHGLMSRVWKRDPVVLNWIGANLTLIQRPDCRLYDKIANHRRHDPEGWREWAVNMCIGLIRPEKYTSRADENERVKLCIVANLLNEKLPKKQCEELYLKQCQDAQVTGGSRADFYNVKQRYVRSTGKR